MQVSNFLILVTCLAMIAFALIVFSPEIHQFLDWPKIKLCKPKCNVFKKIKTAFRNKSGFIPPSFATYTTYTITTPDPRKSTKSKAKKSPKKGKRLPKSGNTKRSNK